MMSAILNVMAGWRGSGPSGSGRPGPDGHHDDLDENELEKISVEIPDDARDLSTDLERWLAEEAVDEAMREPAPGPAPDSRPRRPGGHPPTGPPLGPSAPRSADAHWSGRRAARKRRLAITAGVVVVSMAVVAISGAVGAWIVGPQASSPPPAPLASNGLEPGQLGGLLPPDAVLQNGEASVTAQSVRPAVIALVAEGCVDCEELLTNVAQQAESFGVPLVAVGSPGQAEQLDALADTVGTSRLITLTDPANRLRQVYGLTESTLLLVRADGAVVDVLGDPLANVRLESTLIDLVPGVGTET